MENVRQILVMRTRYPDPATGGTRKLRQGKLIAQGAHAAMAFLSQHFREGQSLNAEERAWIEGKFTKICVGVETEEELLAVFEAAKDAGLTVHLITDAGDTEFHGVPTRTCLAVGPHAAEKLAPITGHLTLL
jgi:peptidyl-tRNA hydrolase, PTH2 family